MAVVALDAVLAEVVARPDVGGTRIVGVDGPSGAGKSTVARRLGAAWGVPVVECDDFVSWSDFAGWWPRFEQEVLSRLVSGRDARYQVRDWKGDAHGSSLSGFKTVAWVPLLIVEGVTCTRAAAGSRVCFRIWVDAPEATRLKRGIERDGERHRDVWLRWMAEERLFFAADDTRRRADLIVDGAPVERCDPENEIALGTV